MSLSSRTGIRARVRADKITVKEQFLTILKYVVYILLGLFIVVLIIGLALFYLNLAQAEELGGTLPREEVIVRITPIINNSVLTSILLIIPLVLIIAVWRIAAQEELRPAGKIAFMILRWIAIVSVVTAVALSIGQATRIAMVFLSNGGASSTEVIDEVNILLTQLGVLILSPTLVTATLAFLISLKWRNEGYSIWLVRTGTRGE